MKYKCTKIRQEGSWQCKGLFQHCQLQDKNSYDISLYIWNFPQKFTIYLFRNFPWNSWYCIVETWLLNSVLDLSEYVQPQGGQEFKTQRIRRKCCIRCGPDEEHILDVVPREDGARNSGYDGELGRPHNTLNNPQAEYIGVLL